MARGGASGSGSLGLNLHVTLTFEFGSSAEVPRIIGEPANPDKTNVSLNSGTESESAWTVNHRRVEPFHTQSIRTSEVVTGHLGVSACARGRLSGVAEQPDDLPELCDLHGWCPCRRSASRVLLIGTPPSTRGTLHPDLSAT